MTGQMYAVPFDIGVYAYACPQDYTPQRDWWESCPAIGGPPYVAPEPVRPFTWTSSEPTPEPEPGTALGLLAQCKARLAEIETLIAEKHDLEIEAETLRAMITATEKNAKP